MTKDIVELLPCPFCGGCAGLNENDWCSPSEWNVFCPDCCAHGAGYTSKENAVATWNRRHIPAGYVIVPREATEAMLRAGDETGCFVVSDEDTRSHQRDADAVWTAMLDAASKEKP